MVRLALHKINVKTLPLVPDIVWKKVIRREAGEKAFLERARQKSLSLGG